MSKAEKRALEAYPVSFYEGTTVDVNEMPRDVFVEGYHQAEKDNELTWEDIKLLQDLSHEVFAEVVKGSVDFYQIYPTEQSFLEEILKRFEDLKKGNNNDLRRRK